MKPNVLIEGADQVFGPKDQSDGLIVSTGGRPKSKPVSPKSPDHQMDTPYTENVRKYHSKPEDRVDRSGTANSPRRDGHENELL
jgi:hypothetical protein